MSIYTPHTVKETEQMLEKLGMESLNGLFTDIPDRLKLKDLDLPGGITQADAEKELTRLAKKNKTYDVILRGCGAYYHYIPAAVREMSKRSEFVTAYTPYQAEMSQGILQSIFEYQTMICNITGMDVSNASHYDGATASAEAAIMCREKNRNKLVVAPFIKQDVLEVIKTYLHDAEIITAPAKDGSIDFEKLSEVLDGNVMALYLEQPSSVGIIEDAERAAAAAHAVGAKFIMNTYPIALGLIKNPCECGADVAVGEGQPLGLNMSFGGPYIGYMATTKAMQRKLPGRIVGETVDRNGNKAYVLTLQAREQHIRREKASSNICSNEAHCALTVGMYLASMGAEGLFRVASACVNNAHYLLSGLREIGFSLVYEGEFFNEFLTVSKVKASVVLQKLEENGILGGMPVSEYEILWCATEMLDKADIDRAVAIIKEVM